MFTLYIACIACTNRMLSIFWQLLLRAFLFPRFTKSCVVFLSVMYTIDNIVSCYVPGLPSTRGEDLQMKCLLELYGLKVM
jgi:hypothetical protein